MTRYARRALDPQEQWDRFAQTLERLTVALDRIERGEAAAAGDLATWLRPLIGADQALNNYAHRVGYELPPLVVGPPPSREPNVALSLGFLPTAPGAEAATTTSLSTWTSREAVVAETPAGTLASWNWRDFVSSYANTYGAHLPDYTPDIFDRTEVLGTAGLHIHEFAIRQIGVVVEETLTGLLNAAGPGTVATPARSGLLNGVAITAITVFRGWADPAGRTWPLWVEVDHRTERREVDILRITEKGVALTFGVGSDGMPRHRVEGGGM